MLAARIELLDEPALHRLAEVLAVTDAVLLERHAVQIGEQVERARRQHGECVVRRGGPGSEVPPLPELGREGVGVAEEHGG
jgi:hypothetical protein